LGTTTACEQELAGFVGGPQIFIDRLAGLFGQFKSDWSAGLLLAYGCAIRSVSARGDIVLINTLAHEPMASFGGFKQSDIGREYGDFGLEAYLEPKSLLGLYTA
jgi:Aldehyde dehydrogenase family